MSSSFEASFNLGAASSAQRREPEQPMRMLVLADLSGDTLRRTSLAERKFQRLDVDNFDQVFEKIQPSVNLAAADSPELAFTVEFKELEEFHPDHLFQTLPVFRELASLRKRLLDNNSFADAARELGQALPSLQESDSEANGDAVGKAATAESDSDTLERVLGKNTSGESGTQVDISQLIHSIVAPHIVPSADPRQEEYVASVDQAISAQMRGVLHAPGFQSLEATWRGLQRMVAETETSEELQLFVWDVTRDELIQAGQSAGDRLEDSLLFQRLVTQRDQQPWSVIVSEACYGKELADLVLLSQLGALAAQSGAVLLGGAKPELVGCQTWGGEISAPTPADPATGNWMSLRASPVAQFIALAGPRVLVRLPYGEKTDEIDSFAFDEIADPQAEHDRLLWGSPGTAVATLLAQSFVDSGWAMTAGEHLEVDDLPMVTYSHDGETHLKACAEVYLPERTAESVLASGVMPLVSYKNRNAARLLRFQSIADPLKALAGPWTG